MASSMSSCCGGHRTLWRLARQWYAHTAGILLMWTRISLPLALAAAWFGGSALPVLVAPMASALYAAGWVCLRQMVRLPLRLLKLADSALLAASALGAAAMLGRTPALVTGAGLFAVAWVLNWRHTAAPDRPGSGEIPLPPRLVPPVTGPVTAGYRSYDLSHTGIDVGVPEGTPVVAPAAGTVLHAGPLEQWGHAVWIDHGGGWSTFVAHLDRLGARRSTQVQTGQVVGWSGTSGISTGPHVHVELRYNGAPVDPTEIVVS